METDDRWLLLMQLYMKKPVGVKPIYSKPVVALSLELHIPPEEIYSSLHSLRRSDTPLLRRLWARYGNDARGLAKATRQVRLREGFGSAGAFYDGVQVNEVFEADFRPAPGCGDLMPMELIMVLDLYFRLIPATMVSETPEVRRLARLMKRDVTQVVELLALFRRCDPYLNTADDTAADDTPLLQACQSVWRRFANDNPQNLAALAAQMKEYFG